MAERFCKKCASPQIRSKMQVGVVLNLQYQKFARQGVLLLRLVKGCIHIPILSPILGWDASQPFYPYLSPKSRQNLSSLAWVKPSQLAPRSELSKVLKSPNKFEKPYIFKNLCNLYLIDKFLLWPLGFPVRTLPRNRDRDGKSLGMHPFWKPAHNSWN